MFSTYRFAPNFPLKCPVSKPGHCPVSSWLSGWDIGPVEAHFLDFLPVYTSAVCPYRGYLLGLSLSLPLEGFLLVVVGVCNILLFILCVCPGVQWVCLSSCSVVFSFLRLSRYSSASSWLKKVFWVPSVDWKWSVTG